FRLRIALDEDLRHAQLTRLVQGMRQRDGSDSLAQELRFDEQVIRPSYLSPGRDRVESGDSPVDIGSVHHVGRDALTGHAEQRPAALQELCAVAPHGFRSHRELVQRFDFSFPHRSNPNAYAIFAQPEPRDPKTETRDLGPKPLASNTLL